MFQKLVSLNEDLKKMIDKGYAVTVDSTNHLVIRDVPYLDAEGQLKIGALVAKLKFIDQFRFEQEDHQVYFAGEVPYGLGGMPIQNLGGGSCLINLSQGCNDVVVQRSFSNKPKAAGKYNDHYHKIEIYVGMISGPAIHKFQASPYTFRMCDEAFPDPIFKFRDTLTSRASLADLSEKFSNEIVAIIGLGGTGAYVLDFIVKMPVKEIRGYDHDFYHVHNAYRSPGRLQETEFGKLKAEIYQDRYENFRHGLSIKNICVDASTRDELAGVTFVFVCIDDGDARREVFDLLIDLKIPFIDVGLGLKRSNAGSLSGMLRTTYFPEDQAEQVRQKKWANESEDPNNLYKSNIQISELNALNACIAVLQYKQLKGFFNADSESFNTLFNISSVSMVRESNLDEN
ncbi:MAG: ThiF family adenylyltransferase [Pseudomonadota bacterium]